MSCTANDFGFDHIFSRFVDGLGRRGDVLLAISTSGTSKNILKAAEAAKAVGMKVVSLTGKAPGSALAKLADTDICTPGGSKYSDRIQELHIKVIHILVELIERQLCQENYK
jgi:D-sedoheptulose 7-phosphate isomerase